MSKFRQERIGAMELYCNRGNCGQNTVHEIFTELDKYVMTICQDCGHSRTYQKEVKEVTVNA